MKHVLTLLCLSSLALVLSAAAAHQDIVIGMSAPFTGPSRGLGIELYRGAAAYFEHINRAGGIAGARVVIKSYDDGYNPAPAIHNTIRLIEQDRVLLLFGYVGASTVTRILPLLKTDRQDPVLLFFPFSGAQPHREAPYADVVFNLRTSYRHETAGLVAHLVSIGRRKIGLFYQADAYGRSGWDGVRRALSANGLRIAAEATYRRGTDDARQLTEQVRILRSAGVDAVISIGAYPACAAFITNARDAGWRVPIANVSLVGSENLAALLADAARSSGRDYSENLINSQVVPSYEDTSLPAVREYRDMMARYRPGLPSVVGPDYVPVEHSFVSFEGFLSAKLLVEVLGHIDGPPSRRGLREAAERVRNFNLGTGGVVSFGPQVHEGLSDVYYTTLRQGRFVPLTSWERWKQ